MREEGRGREEGWVFCAKKGGTECIIARTVHMRECVLKNEPITYIKMSAVFCTIRIGLFSTRDTFRVRPAVSERTRGAYRSIEEEVPKNV